MTFGLDPDFHRNRNIQGDPAESRQIPKESETSRPDISDGVCEGLTQLISASRIKAVGHADVPGAKVFLDALEAAFGSQP